MKKVPSSWVLIVFSWSILLGGMASGILYFLAGKGLLFVSLLVFGCGLLSIVLRVLANINDYLFFSTVNSFRIFNDTAKKLDMLLDKNTLIEKALEKNVELLREIFISRGGDFTELRSSLNEITLLLKELVNVISLVEENHKELKNIASGDF
ncbi:hypothetical protein J7K70_00375, partial [bacterium]|nr:hypothetical protein [bacterium]